MTMNELFDIVQELNQELFDKYGEVEYGFSFSTDGSYSVVKFSELHIWDTENDGREYREETDDYEDLEQHIRTMFNETMSKLATYKL